MSESKTIGRSIFSAIRNWWQDQQEKARQKQEDRERELRELEQRHWLTMQWLEADDDDNEARRAVSKAREAVHNSVMAGTENTEHHNRLKQELNDAIARRIITLDRMARIDWLGGEDTPQWQVDRLEALREEIG